MSKYFEQKKSFKNKFEGLYLEKTKFYLLAISR